MHKFVTFAVQTLLLALPLTAANLIQNPGFEDPVLGSEFAIFSAPGFLPDWVWDGPGSGLLLRTDYTENGTWLFPAHSGQNSLDLTGPGWTGNNVIYQDIPTVIGQLYNLTFWLGNQEDRLAPYGFPSTLEVLIDGVSAGPFGLSHTGAPTVVWADFEQLFTASATTTRIAFRNVTNSADNYVGLDDVSVTDVAGIPEPSLAFPGLAAIALMLAARRRRRRSTVKNSVVKSQGL